MTIKKIQLANISRSKTNPRKKFPKAKLEKVRRSIEATGLISPLMVRSAGDAFELVAGECRYRAVTELGWDSVECVVRELSDKDVATIQMAENVDRHDLNPMEESGGLARMVELGMSADEVAETLGFGRKWVQGRLALGELPKVAQKALIAETLTMASAEAILKVPKGDREAAVQDLMEFADELTTAHVLQYVDERYLVPRERRRKWRAWCGSVAADWEGVATFLEDPYEWAKYVHPYGKPTGRWRLGAEVIGAAAARESEREVTWGQLAKSLGVVGILVPVAGVVNDTFKNVVMLVDGAMIQAAEKAARKSGEPYTLGPRIVETWEEVEDGDPGEGEEPGEDPGGDEVGGILEELRFESWSPWVVDEFMGGLDEKSERLEAIILAFDVLSEADPEWVEDVCGNQDVSGAEFREVISMEFDGFGEIPFGIWWILKGPVSDVRLVRIASKLGLLDIWREGRAR